MIRQSMFRKATLLLSGNMAASALLFARNLLVAWLIPIEDYGVAMTFAVAMAVVEMGSALGMHQQIVQAKDGNDPQFQAALQGFQLLRGAIISACLFLFAVPVAQFFGIPEAAWAYQVLAVIPLLNALEHFDTYRRQRSMTFLPTILTSVLPAGLSVLAVWPLSLYFGDWRIMLYALVAQAAATTLLSHLLAERRWRLLLDRSVMLRSLRFGWPILLGAVMMFLANYGEKAVVGRELGMEALAIFAMGLTLSLTPILVVTRSIAVFFLPLLSAAAGADPPRFARLAMVVSQCYFILAMSVAIGLLLLGPWLVDILLGDKFASLPPILAWFAVLQGIWALKLGAHTVALSLGQTENALAADLFRSALFPVAWWAVVQTGDMRLMIWIAMIGECLAVITAFALLRRRANLSLRSLRLPMSLSAATIATGGLFVSALWSFGIDGPALQLLGWMMTVLFVAALAAMRDLYDEVTGSWRRMGGS
jgi:O-antigen/teichoic acid export membrane protein